MRILAALFLFIGVVSNALGQLEVGLNLKRVQYVAHEPVIATVRITNRTGRPIEFQNGKGQPWFGFEITARDSQILAPMRAKPQEPSLHLEPGEMVTRKVNLTSLFPVQDVGAYHVRANVYFGDLNRFFSSATKVFQVAEGRLIWQKTIGVPEGEEGAGEVRTYSLLSYRFPDHTSIYARVENRERGVVYATYSLGRLIAYDDPQTELDPDNQLHVLHCAAPRSWAYSHIDVNGQLLGHSMFVETKTRPRLRQAANGKIEVKGGQRDVSVVQSERRSHPELPGQRLSPPAED